MSKRYAFVWAGVLSLLLWGCTIRVVTRDEGETPDQDAVWVCHGTDDPRWVRVAAPAADAHRRHGDAISPEPREADSGCDRADRDSDDERSAGGDGDPGSETMWVCHGDQDRRWIRVAAPAAEAHRRHGDPVSSRPRESGSDCGTPDRESGDDESGDDDGDRGDAAGRDAVWVCHGNQNPRWMRVAGPAVDAHRRHGDVVSSRPRERGAECGADDRDPGPDQDRGHDRDQNPDHDQNPEPGRDGDQGQSQSHGQARQPEQAPDRERLPDRHSGDDPRQP